jgi:hypothetical protein
LSLLTEGLAEFTVHLLDDTSLLVAHFSYQLHMPLVERFFNSCHERLLFSFAFLDAYLEALVFFRDALNPKKYLSEVQPTG